MITTEELVKWFYEVIETKKTSLVMAEKHANNTAISEYYVHLAQVADAQLSLIERLIRQSVANDIKGE